MWRAQQDRLAAPLLAALVQTDCSARPALLAVSAEPELRVLILLAVFIRQALGTSQITDRLALRQDQTTVAVGLRYLNLSGVTAAWVAEALTLALAATVAMALTAAVVVVVERGPRAARVAVAVTAL